MVASNWYAVAAAVVLLALAALNRPWVTLVAAVCGLGIGLVLAVRGPLGRSGIFGMVGFALAAGLAAFTLLKTMGG